MSTYCTKCGQIGHLYVHCPNLSSHQSAEPDPPEIHNEPRNPVSVAADEAGISPAERVKTWRKDNPEKYREYMRRYMRRRRAGG